MCIEEEKILELVKPDGTGKIKTIKFIRDLYGCSLVEAGKYVNLVIKSNCKCDNFTYDFGVNYKIDKTCVMCKEIIESKTIVFNERINNILFHLL